METLETRSDTLKVSAGDSGPGGCLVQPLDHRWTQVAPIHAYLVHIGQVG